MAQRGRFIMIDGIAGSGKSTLLRAAQEWAAECKHRVFDLREWTKVHADPPHFDEVADHDVFFTFEPTRQWVGAAIRFELSRTDEPYSGITLAHAFSLDREMMYNRLIVPALQAGKTVIQDRGVCTSIVYQPIMAGGISLRRLLKLPGNALALRHAPDTLIITDLDPEIAVERIKKRDEESKGVFADLAFLRRVTRRFRSRWFSFLFTHYGAAVHSFDTGIPLDSMNARAKQLINDILKTC
jgi:thymidylate kinase